MARVYNFSAGPAVLPEEVLWRKKSPYPKTHDPSYLSIVREKLQQILQEKDSPLLQIVSRGALESLTDDRDPWPWYGQLMQTPQTIAFMLQINFWLMQYNVKIV